MSHSFHSIHYNSRSAADLDTASPSYTAVAGEEDQLLGTSGMPHGSMRGFAMGRGGGGLLGDDRGQRGGGGISALFSRRVRRFIVVAVIVVLVFVAILLTEPRALASVKKKFATGEGSAGSARLEASKHTGGSKPSSAPLTGRDGSVVTAADGSTFVYNNSFGGFWNAIPFNDSAQAQSYVPPLNKPWDYNENLIHGVNLGGWLTIEPFIVPSLFEPFNSPVDSPTATHDAVDEWTLSLALGSNMSAVIEDHYNTFITEKDFAEIAGAGLNWVRIPIPYWFIEVYSGEPFLANVGWKYFLKAIEWARKYGIRINLDLHAVPGSQNGWNHSGKLGSVNFLNGVMGIANAQRTMNYIRTLAEFISQPQYSNVVPMFSILNEPQSRVIGSDPIKHFYLEAYNVIRGISGIGEGHGPFIVFSTAFAKGAAKVWDSFLPGMDRAALDTHSYLCFTTPSTASLSVQAAKPCTHWAGKTNNTQRNFGLAVTGEWSLAVNDCGKWINGVGSGHRYEGTYYAGGPDPQFPGVGKCDAWNDWSSYTPEVKEGLQLVAQAHVDALRHWFFWTWKTGYSNVLGTIANPLWNYQLALENGFMPKSPREALGACPSIVAAAGLTMKNNPAPPLFPWMTGGSGAGTITASRQLASYSAWPPTALGTTPAEFLPTYTPTGKIVTMSASTPTSYPEASVTNVAGSGWAQPADTAGWYVPVEGCSYPHPWSGVDAVVPTKACTGGGDGPGEREKRIRHVVRPTRHGGRPTPTPMPSNLESLSDF